MNSIASRLGWPIRWGNGPGGKGAYTKGVTTENETDCESEEEEDSDTDEEFDEDQDTAAAFREKYNKIFSQDERFLLVSLTKYGVS